MGRTESLMDRDIRNTEKIRFAFIFKIDFTAFDGLFAFFLILMIDRYLIFLPMYACISL